MQDLAAQSALPVAAEVSPERLPPAIEATAYFVVSEALTNAGKHASARQSEVKADVEDGVLRLEVCHLPDEALRSLISMTLRGSTSGRASRWCPRSAS